MAESCTICLPVQIHASSHDSPVKILTMKFIIVSPLFIRLTGLFPSLVPPFPQLSFLWGESNHLLVAKFFYFIFYFDLFWYHQLGESSFHKCLSWYLLVLLLLESCWPWHLILLWISLHFLGEVVDGTAMTACVLAGQLSISNMWMVLELRLGWFRQRFIKGVPVTDNFS